MPRLLPLFALLAATLVFAPPRLAGAEDSVVVVAQDGSRRRLSGQVIDYTGTQLRLATGEGRETQLPADRVVKIETQLSEAHRQGNEQFALGEYEAALER